MCIGVSTVALAAGMMVLVCRFTLMKEEFDLYLNLKWLLKGEVTVVPMNQVVGGRHLLFKSVDFGFRGSRQGDYERVTATDGLWIGWGFERFLSFTNLKCVFF